MKPIAILASLLTLAPAQEAPHPAEPSPAATQEPEVDLPEAPPAGTGPLATITSDRAALFVDLAKSKHTPVRARTRDPFLFPAEQTAGKSLQAIDAERAETARVEHDAIETAPAAAQADPPPDPIATLVASVQALEINAVLVAKDGGSCLVRGDIVRIGDSILGGATLSRVHRDGVSFTVGDRVVDVALLDRRAPRAAEDSLPLTTIADGEDTGS